MNSLLQAFGALIFVGLSGAAFTLGVAVVARWLKWAPINITINSYKPDSDQ